MSALLLKIYPAVAMAQWTIPAMNRNFLSQLILNKINISLVSTEIWDQRRIRCDNQTNLTLCPTL